MNEIVLIYQLEKFSETTLNYNLQLFKLMWLPISRLPNISTKNLPFPLLSGSEFFVLYRSFPIQFCDVLSHVQWCPVIALSSNLESRWRNNIVKRTCHLMEWFFFFFWINILACSLLIPSWVVCRIIEVWRMLRFQSFVWAGSRGDTKVCCCLSGALSFDLSCHMVINHRIFPLLVGLWNSCVLMLSIHFPSFSCIRSSLQLPPSHRV